MSNNERLMKVLLSPRITEKSTLVGDKHNQFVFKVVKDASKPEIILMKFACGKNNGVWGGRNG